jgi:hypothetical protein
MALPLLHPPADRLPGFASTVDRSAIESEAA